MTDPDRPERIEHRIERVYRVPATSEEVWEVIATARGISSWMVPARLEPRVGGEVAFDLGDVVSTGVITAYTPGRRFAYEESWQITPTPDEVSPEMAEWFASRGIPLSQVYQDLANASPIATEFLVEAESGGSCVIRVVTSAYGSGADWEKEFFDQMATDYTPLLDNLTTRFTAPVAS